MLKRYTLKNYKNFKDEITIDFENIAGYQFNTDCLSDAIIGKMLIYGRNATGKTNLGRAILDIGSTMFGGTRYASNGILLNADSKEDEAMFQYEFRFEDSELSYKYCLDYGGFRKFAPTILTMQLWLDISSSIK